MKTKTLKIARAGIIAALYITLTLLFASISFSSSGFQVRVSEALTVLPLFFPESVLGLFAGCLLSNIISGNVLDVIIGSAATLAAALLTMLCRRIKNRHLRVIAGVLPPVIINALAVPVPYTFLAGVPDLYWAEVVTVGIGQLISAGVLGAVLYYVMEPKFGGEYNGIKK